MALHLIQIFDKDSSGQEYLHSLQIFDYAELLRPERVKALFAKAGLGSDFKVEIIRE